LAELKIQELSEACNRILAELNASIVGKESVLRKIMVGILANSHMLIEDYPGLAKTVIAKSVATTVGCRFARVQFTPDLLPADITGTYIYNQKTSEFELRRGPIFTNILLADEINRSPPKTQAALLEAMQERQTTLDGRTHRLEDPFIVLATQNPIEFEGVYQLPEAQLDRFVMRLRIGYPDRNSEMEILKGRIHRGTDDFSINTIVDAKTLVDMQRTVESVHADDGVLSYITDIVRETRTHSQVEVGASPRGSLALLKLARANAALDGRDYIIPDDVKIICQEALAHRIIPKTASWVHGFDASIIVDEALKKIPVPRVD
jgi:MoxR-like ATPase